MNENKRHQGSSWHGFSSAAFKEFESFRESRELCDVFICVAGTEIPAHRVVLAALSPYFRAMFTGKMAESTQSKITLRDIDPSAVEQIIEFFYTGRVLINEDNVHMLLCASCLLQVDRVRSFCCDFLAQQICVSNCLGIRALTDSLSCTEIFRSAEKFVAENFLEVMQCEEFLLQPYESLIGLLEQDYLDICAEIELLEGVLKWLRWGTTTRSRHTYTLLKRIQLMRVDVQYLNLLSLEPVIKSNPECLELILDTIEALSSPNVISALEFPMYQYRQYRPGKEVLFAVGGESVGMTLETVECFDLETQKWDWTCPLDSETSLLPHLSQSRMYACVSSTGNHVYTIGGSSAWKALDLVERYDSMDNQWTPCASLNQERLGAGSAVLDTQLLAIGGCGKAGYLSSVESYDPLTAKWTLIGQLPSRRCYHEVAVLNGYVYVVGGYGGDSGTDDIWLSNVDCLIPSGDVWVSVAPMLQARTYFGLAEHAGSLYAAGGYTSSWIRSVERYDPREGHWYVAQPMMSPRSSMGISVLGDRIYVAGGFDGVKNLNTMECYDVKAGKWSRSSPMRSVRYGMALTTLQL